jgi:general L-amino acid transport system substrate-binding protein
MTHFCSRAAAGLAALGATFFAFAAYGGTLDSIKQRGALICGVNEGLGGFSVRDAAGAWSGFDVDFCHALAAAVLDDPQKVQFVALTNAERFDALREGKMDVLSRNSTWTLEREAGQGILFAGVAYHDGQGFMVLRHPKIDSALELDGVSVCVQDGTTTRPNLADFFKANSMTYKEVLVAGPDEAVARLESGACDAYTTDESALYVVRLGLKKPAEATILPDVISKEPLSPAVRADDVAWFNIVRWTLYALIDAEELGVGQATLDEAQKSQRPDVRRLIGAEGDLGQSLGLTNDWALRALRAVGNYGEMFERNLGAHSRYGVPRGLNQLWAAGGVLYAPPLR